MSKRPHPRPLSLNSLTAFGGRGEGPSSPPPSSPAFWEKREPEKEIAPLAPAKRGDRERGWGEGVSRRGFTLLEIMLALVMLGFILFAISLAMSVALRTQAASIRRQDDTAEVRGIFAVLSRDLSEAYGSLNNPVSLFTTSGGPSQNKPGLNVGGGSGDALLMFSTLSHRIEADDPSAAGNDQESGASSFEPQSDIALVRYDLDPQTHSLSRLLSAVPNLDAIAQAANDPAHLLSRRVLSLTLRFWDNQNKEWRSSWDFQQQNQQSSSTQNQTQTQGQGQNQQQGQGQQLGQGQQNGQNANGQTGQNDANNAQSSQNQGDSTLPGAVEITLTLLKSDNTPATYKSFLPILSPQPMEKIQAAQTGQGTQNENGQNANGQNPGGQNGQGNGVPGGTNGGQPGNGNTGGSTKPGGLGGG